MSKLSTSGSIDHLFSQRERTPHLLGGVKDPISQQLRRIKTAGGRRREGLYLAEGPDLCARAVRYGAEVTAFIGTDRFLESSSGVELIELMPSAVKICRASEGLLNKCLEAKPTPPCVALVRRMERVWDPKKVVGEVPLWLGVDAGENADNLGMLLRSAEATGVSGVLLSGGTVDPWGRRVVRAARGAMFSLPLALHESSVDAVIKAQSEGYQVITTSAKATLRYTEVDYRTPTLIIVGNEHHGVDEAVVERSDQCVMIPMLGHIHSLNIAVAASLMMFEAQRQREWEAAPRSAEGHDYVD